MASTVQIKVVVRCPDALPEIRWIDVTMQGRVVVPRPRPQDFVPGLYDRVQRRLPKPIPRIAPADWDPDGYAFVQTPVFFWVDQAEGQWATVSGTASVPGLSVTVQVEPVELVIHTGDGNIVRCPGAPRPFPQGADPDQFQGCEHVYIDSSAMAPNGETFPVTASVVWHATWSASDGQSGDLGTLTTTSEVRGLPVAEIQAVIVDN